MSERKRKEGRKEEERKEKKKTKSKERKNHAKDRQLSQFGRKQNPRKRRKSFISVTH